MAPLAELKSGRGMPHHAKWVRTPGVINPLPVPPWMKEGMHQVGSVIV